MADKVIVVKERRRGSCGCILCVLLSAGVVWLIYSCHQDMERTAAQIRAQEAALTPEQRAARAIEKPLDDIIPLKFANALKPYLRNPDSYKPGSVRYHDHPRGYVYFHDYNAQNGFGGYAREVCGLLCETNTGQRVWTFYTHDQVDVLFRECGVK